MRLVMNITMAELGLWEKNFSRELFRKQHNVLRAMGKDSVALLAVHSRQIKWKGRFQRGWRKKTSKWSLTIYNRAISKKGYHYGINIEFGRRRGARMPPHAPLLEWVESKLGLRGHVAQRVTYLVRRKIHKLGIDARPVMTSQNLRKRLQRTFLVRMGFMWDGAANRSRTVSAPRAGGAA